MKPGKLLSWMRAQDNLDEAPDDEDFVPGGKKKECQKQDTQPNPGTREGPVCLNPTVLAVGWKEKRQVDHMSVQVVQRSMRIYLFKYLGLIKDNTILSKLFFYTDIMCKDGSVVPGGEWPSMDWMTDTPSLGATTRDMSWFMGFCHSLFSCVRAISDFQYPRKLSLKDPIKPRAKSKDVSPIWGVYIEYPLPTEWNLGGTVTGFSDRMGGPHAFNSLTPYTTVDPAT